MPLVKFALARRGMAESTDYWDIATALELACCEEDWQAAPTLARRALAVVSAKKDSFMAATTLNNFHFLREGLIRASRDIATLEQIMQAYEDMIKELKG